MILLYKESAGREESKGYAHFQSTPDLHHQQLVKARVLLRPPSAGSQTLSPLRRSDAKQAILSPNTPQAHDSHIIAARLAKTKIIENHLEFIHLSLVSPCRELF